MIARILFAVVLLGSATAALGDGGNCKLVHPGADDKLVYQSYDSLGDTIPDFSNCGYMGGGVAIPDVPQRLTLHPDPSPSDDGARIQKAIDQVSAMPPDSNGFRGALLLTRGTYRIADSIRIAAGGVVLRGEGEGEDGTILVATGTKQRRLIQVEAAQGISLDSKSAQKITDPYVPVGSHSVTVADAHGFAVGDTIIVKRFGNARWIHELKMDEIIGNKSGTVQWTAFSIDSDRVVTAVAGNKITFDAPICCAIDPRWGGGEVLKYSDPGRITQIGVEYLRGISDFNSSVTEVEHGQRYPADENHALGLISFDNCKNGWARHIVALHFYHGVAIMDRGAKWITVQDSQSLDPVSIITGGRRYPFCIMGQLQLVQRCYSRNERHAFVVNGSHLAGPDVFLDCRSEQDWADSGPHQRWSTGTLWDDVHGVLHTQDREDMGTGHGYAGANDVYWNCTGSIIIQQPPTAQNFAIGFVGQKDKPAFTQLHHPDGYYESFGVHVTPMSLYLEQLRDRLGPQAVQNISTSR